MTTRYEALKALVLAEAASPSFWEKKIAELETAEPNTVDKLRRVAAECRQVSAEPEDKPIGEAMAAVFEAAAELESRGYHDNLLLRVVIEAGELMYEQVAEAEG